MKLTTDLSLKNFDGLVSSFEVPGLFIYPGIHFKAKNAIGVCWFGIYGLTSGTAKKKKKNQLPNKSSIINRY